MSRKHKQSKLASPKNAPHRRQKQKTRNLSWLWASLGILLVAVLGILVLRPKATDSTELTLAQVKAKIQQGAFLLDVRTQQEWDQFHLASSTLIPLDELPDRLNELPKDQDIFVVGLSGQRAQSGVTLLKQAGFSRVSFMSGGLQAWMNAGYPVDSGLP
jgi:rhodanese-related sulfurtransferase